MRKLLPLEIRRPSLEELLRLPRHPIVLVAENIRSLHNVGSFFRTADGARIEKVYLTGFTGTPERAEVRKTALGAEASVPWEHDPDTLAVLERLRAAGYRIAALELTDRSRPYHAVRPEEFPLALVVGNELTGVSDAALQRCDFALEIPQYGIKHSLNVSVAAGVVLFTLVHLYREACGLPSGYTPEQEHLLGRFRGREALSQDPCGLHHGP
ncbi:MAG: RNA methyltransferase [Bacteroidetes bacterium]|nr:RNA methyltransferase [Bacteroidota bacterium]